MQRQSVRRFFLTGLLLISLGTPLAVEAQGTSGTKGTALVIGNGDYRFSPLTSSTNDARDISETLKQMGFAVTLVLDADQAAIETNINDFGKKLHNGGTGLFYYSGHGVQHAGGNYLVPIGTDAAISTPEQLRYKAVNVGYVIGAMKEAGNSLNIVILDACRNSPFKGFVRSVERGLVREQGAEGMIIAYATSPGKVALDGSGRNSPYTKHLLSQMTVANVPIEIMFKNVRSAVVKETSGEQTPWYESSIAGNFSFVRGTSGSVVPAPVVERVTPRVVMPIQPPQLSEADRRTKVLDLKRKSLTGEVITVTAGVGFEGLPLGSTSEQVEEVFGRPSEIKETTGLFGMVYELRKESGGYELCCRVDNVNNRLKYIELYRSHGKSPVPIRTAKGISFGDSEAAVIRAYGTPDSGYTTALHYGKQGISFMVRLGGKEVGVWEISIDRLWK